MLCLGGHVCLADQALSPRRRKILLKTGSGSACRSGSSFRPRRTLFRRGRIETCRGLARLFGASGDAALSRWLYRARRRRPMARPRRTLCAKPRTSSLFSTSRARGRIKRSKRSARPIRRGSGSNRCCARIARLACRFRARSAGKLDVTRARVFLPSMAITTLSQRGGHQWSLPNILTYGRVVAVPVVVTCLYWSEIDTMRWVALAIFMLWRRSRIFSMAISPARGRSSRRSGKCSTPSPTSSSSRRFSSCWLPTGPSRVSPSRRRSSSCAGRF